MNTLRILQKLLHRVDLPPDRLRRGPAVHASQTHAAGEIDGLVYVGFKRGVRFPVPFDRRVSSVSRVDAVRTSFPVTL
jgi:hypothetical protein